MKLVLDPKYTFFRIVCGIHSDFCGPEKGIMLKRCDIIKWMLLWTSTFKFNLKYNASTWNEKPAFELPTSWKYWEYFIKFKFVRLIIPNCKINSFFNDLPILKLALSQNHSGQNVSVKISPKYFEESVRNGKPWL